MNKKFVLIVTVLGFIGYIGGLVFGLLHAEPGPSNIGHLIATIAGCMILVSFCLFRQAKFKCYIFGALLIFGIGMIGQNVPSYSRTQLWGYTVITLGSALALYFENKSPPSVIIMVFGSVVALAGFGSNIYDPSEGVVFGYIFGLAGLSVFAIGCFLYVRWTKNSLQ